MSASLPEVRNVRGSWRTPAVALLFGGVILTLSLGIRHGFGLFLQPMSGEYGWGREVFAFAIALQNLVWGLAQPFAGMVADRFGTGRVLAAGGVLYALGLALMAYSDSPLTLSLSAGLLIGLGLSGTAFSVVYGALGRAFPPHKRSMAFGIAGAAGSFGQFIMLPVEQSLIGALGWFEALLILAVLAAFMAPLSAALAERRDGGTAGALSGQTMREALVEAGGHSGFRLLCFGFFVCGFQVVFIAVHLPAFLTDQGLPARVGMMALALIGLFNIVGTYAAGWLGGHYRKKYLLAGIYLVRAGVISVFLLVPITEVSVYLFAAGMGLLWLSTVPLTNGVVAQIFGVKYLSTLFGFVFLGHQVGSFMGVWLGGFLFDLTGTYDAVWAITIGLGVLAALLHWPIDDRELRPASFAGAPVK
ncbi:MAG: MFS transporter [Burkholderiales bacterium]|nr:MAG: MFS transporter [Burkholderiales bacterium]